MTKSPRARLSFIAILALSAGCGDDGGSAVPMAAPTLAAPTDHQVFHVQRATAAVGAVSKVSDVASDIIIMGDEGKATPGPKSLPTHPGATPSFDYGADVDFIIDFDALDPDGNDLHPDATGQVHVTAAGTDSDTPDAGEATFSAAVVAESDLVFTEPGTGVLTGIPAGAFWSHQLTVTWSRSDDHNWTVTATSLTTLDFTGLAVFDGTTVVTVDIAGEREVVVTRTRGGGKMTQERSVQGSLVVTTDDGTNVETVTLDYVKPGHARIAVGGNLFGPMTEGRVRTLFRAFIP